jgi:D-aminopeptidase
VLVQTNFGGVLTIAGAPVGRELGRYYLKDELDRESRETRSNPADGSVIVVIATDAPADHRNLSRMASRSMMGLARTGSAASNGSGDYVIAFSTARGVPVLANDAMSPLFLAVIEATEEAVYNSLFRAVTMSGNGHTVEALPIERTLEILRNYRAIGPRSY